MKAWCGPSALPQPAAVGGPFSLAPPASSAHPAREVGSAPPRQSTGAGRVFCSASGSAWSRGSLHRSQPGFSTRSLTGRDLDLLSRARISQQSEAVTARAARKPRAVGGRPPHCKPIPPVDSSRSGSTSVRTASTRRSNRSPGPGAPTGPAPAPRRRPVPLLDLPHHPVAKPVQVLGLGGELPARSSSRPDPEHPGLGHGRGGSGGSGPVAAELHPDGVGLAQDDDPAGPCVPVLAHQQVAVA